MKKQLARTGSIVAAVAATGALVVGGQSGVAHAATHHDNGGDTNSSKNMTYAEAKAKLDVKAKGLKRTTPVHVPSGAWEAADWDTKGNVWFMSTTGTGSWHVIGSSKYPVMGGQPGDAEFYSSRFKNAPHATYVAQGGITGDSSGNAMAYGAKSASAWGTLVREGDSLIPTGKPPSGVAGLWEDARFTSGDLEKGRLETWVGNPFTAVAGQRSYPLIDDWKWDQSSNKFVNSASNVFVTKWAPTPKPATQSPSSCPTKLDDGNYAVGVEGSAPTSGGAPYSTVNVGISSRDSGNLLCSVSVDKRLPVTAYVGTDSGSGWATVPSWMLATTLTPGAESPVKVYADQVDVGKSPLLAPAMTSINVDLGTSTVPATVTVKDGKITGIGLTQRS